MSKDIEEAKRNAYRIGYMDGLEAYAWMKDGVMYVGTTGTIFADAKAKLGSIWNYHPEKLDGL